MPIEAILTASKFIEQAILWVIKKLYHCPDCSNEKTIEKYAEKKNIVYNDYSELITSEEIKEFIKKEVVSVNENLAQFERIKTFIILSEGFTVENGLLTATLKLKRNRSYEKYAKQIEQMYNKEKVREIIY
uniref:Uncharacterized protein n=1 Tax=candidate division WOR-3 bacterium TaxID=2052148 RepID=A0A7V1EIM7_UNCW3